MGEEGISLGHIAYLTPLWGYVDPLLAIEEDMRAKDNASSMGPYQARYGPQGKALPCPRRAEQRS